MINVSHCLGELDRDFALIMTVTTMNVPFTFLIY